MSLATSKIKKPKDVTPTKSRPTSLNIDKSVQNKSKFENKSQSVINIKPTKLNQDQSKNY